MRRSALGPALVVSLLALRAMPATAHAVGVSRGEYRAEGAQVRADLVFARRELSAALPGIDADRDGELTSAELDGAHAALSAWIRRGVLVRGPDGPCTGELERATSTEQDGVELAAVFRCPRDAGGVSLRLELLADLSLGHRHLATVTAASDTVHTVLYESHAEVALAAEVRTDERGGVALSMLRLGIEHILTGYDHLLFLLALVLVGGPLRSVLGVVTAFTLAHSVTLAVAATGVWAPRPTLVEPAIALSIAYVGIENCVAPDLRRRWRLTFLFGLVHGFGFAGALREVALSASQLPLALASFNVGVEAGQLAVLSIVLPAVWWLGDRGWLAGGRLRMASAAISTIGLGWFVVRIAGG